MESRFKLTSSYSVTQLKASPYNSKKTKIIPLLHQMGFTFSNQHKEHKKHVHSIIADAVLELVNIPSKMEPLILKTNDKINFDSEEYKLRIRKGDTNKLICIKPECYQPFYGTLKVDKQKGAYYYHNCKGANKSRIRMFTNTDKIQLLFAPHSCWSLVDPYPIKAIIDKMTDDGHLTDLGSFKNIFSPLDDTLIQKTAQTKGSILSCYFGTGVISSKSNRNVSNLNGEYIHWKVKIDSPPLFIGITDADEINFYGIDGEGFAFNDGPEFPTLKYKENTSINVILDFYDVKSCKLYIHYGEIKEYDFKCIEGAKYINKVSNNMPGGDYKLAIAFGDNNSGAEIETTQIYGTSAGQFDDFYRTITKKIAKKHKKSKHTSKSEKSGLLLSVKRSSKYMKNKGCYWDRIECDASIFVTFVLEYLVAELLETAGKEAKKQKKTRIIPIHILSALKNDDELMTVFGKVKMEIPDFDKNKMSKNKDIRIAFNDILYIKEIQHGTYGRVHLGIYKGQSVAIKHPRYEYWRHNYDNNKLNEMFRREIAILGSFKCDGIVKLLGYIEYNNKLFIIMDYFDAELFNIFQIWHQISSSDKQQLFKKLIIDVMPALCEMHSKNIVHRDLKLENILVRCRHNICQFALADVGGLSGSAPYVPAESLKRKQINKANDMFAMGLILLQIIIGHMCLNNVCTWTNPQTPTMSDISAFQDAMWKYVSGQRLNNNSPMMIVKSLLAPNGKNRMSADAITNHSLVQQWRKESYDGLLVNTIPPKDKCAAPSNNHIDYYKWT